MSAFDDLIANTTVSAIRTTIIGYAQGAGLLISNWLVGSVGQQIFETVAQTGYALTQGIANIVRGFASLDTSTDPGDVDAYDSDNAGRTPAPGFLSYYGQNTYGTTRQEATFATGPVLFTNGGSQSRTFAPYALTFTWTANTPPSPAPTYRNAPDPTIYTNPDGTVTVGVNGTLTLTVVADEVGMGSNVPSASSLSLTTTLLGCSATNTASVLGTDREDADVYRARCRQAPARISLGGPSAAYAYLAAKNLDGTPLLNANGAPVAINRVYVSQSSSTGIVTAYYASPSGAAISADVTAANNNIEIQAFAVPDAITFSGVAASNVSIHVVGTASIKARPGLTSAIVKTAIINALAAAFETFEIGGSDQTAGAGVIYTDDLHAIAATAYPGLYNVVITTPGGATTALALGHVATLNSVVGDWAVTLTT
jgi:hypothetical protein